MERVSNEYLTEYLRANLKTYCIILNRENDGKIPTIIFNLQSFVKIVGNIEYGSMSLILGGCYAMYTTKLIDFLDKLRACEVKFVFFCRPYLNALNVNLILEAYDRVVENKLQSYQEHLKKFKKNFYPWHHDMRFLYNLTKICSDYGAVYTNLQGNESRIVQYIEKNSKDVLAMIQHDTDYLLYDVKSQYWSLADLDISALTTKRYCRQKLFNCLKLTTIESFLLSAISRLKWKPNGNSSFLKQLDTLAEYVKRLQVEANGWNGYDLKRIVRGIYGDESRDEHIQELESHLSRYGRRCENDLDTGSYDFVKFCKENLYFAYGLMLESVSTNQALNYIDLRIEESNQYEYIDWAVDTLLRQKSVLFKDDESRPETCKVIRSIDKRSVANDEPINYPESMFNLLVNQIKIYI